MAHLDAYFERLLDRQSSLVQPRPQIAAINVFQKYVQSAIYFPDTRGSYTAAPFLVSTSEFRLYRF
jgi:hypothetical protein